MKEKHKKGEGLDFERDQQMRVDALANLMELMQKHRLAKNMVMWDSTSRLVYEFWHSIYEAEEKHKKGKYLAAQAKETTK